MGIKKSFCLFFILLMASCSNEGIMEKMEQIKTFGNGNPEMALTMLDSLELDVRDKGEYRNATRRRSSWSASQLCCWLLSASYIIFGRGTDI